MRMKHISKYLRFMKLQTATTTKTINKSAADERLAAAMTTFFEFVSDFLSSPKPFDGVVEIRVTLVFADVNELLRI